MSEIEKQSWFSDDKGNKSIGRVISIWSLVLVSLMIIAECVVAFICSGKSPIFSEWVYIALIGTVGGVKAAGKFAERPKS